MLNHSLDSKKFKKASRFCSHFTRRACFTSGLQVAHPSAFFYRPASPPHLTFPPGPNSSRPEKKKEKEKNHRKRLILQTPRISLWLLAGHGGYVLTHIPSGIPQFRNQFSFLSPGTLNRTIAQFSALCTFCRGLPFCTDYDNLKQSNAVFVAPLRCLQNQFGPITKAAMIRVHYVENRVGEVVHRYDIWYT
jgi:hypothetical protein